MNENNSRINLNPEICKIIGAFIGDGYLGNYGKRKNQFIIGFVGDKKLDNKYISKHIKNLIKKNFPFTNPRLRYRNDENTVLLRIYSKKLYKIFLDIGFLKGKKSRTVKIPQQIINDEKLMNATLRGIFDTDGSIFFDKRKKYKQPYPRITIQLASIKLIEQIENYLSKEFKLYVYKKNRNGYRNYLEIYGHEQLEKFLKKIGFSNERHLRRICLCSSAGKAKS